MKQDNHVSTEEIPFEVRQRLSDIVQDFDDELHALGVLGVLTEGDVRRLRVQTKVSRDALLTTIRTKEFDERSRSRLLTAFVQDFEASVERIIENAVARKGGRALLSFKLARIDKKLLLEVRQSGGPLRFEESLLSAMAMTKSYIWRSVGPGGRRDPKPNVQRIADDYRVALLELAQGHGLSTQAVAPRQQ